MANLNKHGFDLMEFMNLTDVYRTKAHEVLDLLQCQGDYQEVLDMMEAETNLKVSLKKIQDLFED